jgi:hypothetical protein
MQTAHRQNIGSRRTWCCQAAVPQSGTDENSPRFQPRVGYEDDEVPEGDG